MIKIWHVNNFGHVSSQDGRQPRGFYRNDSWQMIGVYEPAV